MPIADTNVRVRVRLNNIQHNFRLLQQCGETTAAPLIPVVKSDAYGHGLTPVCRALDEEGAVAFAVGTVAEALRLREAGFGQDIYALLGLLRPDEAAACVDRAVAPLCYRADQLVMLDQAARAAGGTTPVAVKVDTGMNRLGFGAEDVAALVEALRACPSLRLIHVASHLAAADEPERLAVSLEQGRGLAAVREALRGAGFDVPVSLANSAGILAHPDLCFDAQRPGIALYGANPLAGTAWEERGAGLKPAMEATAPVLQVRELPAGESVSYGCTFTAEAAMRVAVIGAGYADAYSRRLSNRGRMNVRGKSAPVVGRVCMQLTVVDVSAIPEAREGDEAYILGGDGEAVTPRELAAWQGTIPYEVFCLLGGNPREYETA